jgi:hypothetical protein
MAASAAEPFSSRIDRRRLVFAIFLLPLFDALLGYITIPFLIRTDAGQAAGSGQASVVFATLSGVLGLLVTITAAAPIAYWLERRGRMSLRDFTLAGALVANAPFAAYLCLALAFTLLHLAAGTLGQHLSSTGELLAGGARALLIDSYMGAASGAVFWVIAIRND